MQLGSCVAAGAVLKKAKKKKIIIIIIFCQTLPFGDPISETLFLVTALPLNFTVI